MTQICGFNGFKGTVSQIFNKPPRIDDNLQRYPLKFCLIKYELDITVDNFQTWIFSKNATFAFLIFKPRKTTINSTLLIR